MTDLFEEEAAAPKAKAKRVKMPKPAPEAKPEALEGEALPPTASAEARTELVVAEAQANPLALFTDEKRYSEFYAKVKAEVSGHEPDLSTDKGRKAIASLAFRVTKAKTALDKAGLGLTEEWRIKIKSVNAARSKMTEELDSLAKEVRRPLTEWEEAEDARLERANSEIERFRLAAIIGDEEDSAAVETRGRALLEEGLDPELFGDLLEDAQAAKDASARALAQAMHRLRKEEADRAELEALRREKEEREERERLEREAREAEDRERAAREAEEARQREREEAEKERVRIAAEAAAQAARDEEARKARAADEAREREQAEKERQRREEEEAREAERQRLEREREKAAEERERQHQAELEEERRKAEEERQRGEAAAAKAQAEREAREREDHERKEAAEKEEAARKRREADKAHRRKIVGESKADILAAVEGLPDEMAQQIVLAIAARTIRHISIEF